MYYYIEPNLLIKESEVEAITFYTKIDSNTNEADFSCFFYTKSGGKHELCDCCFLGSILSKSSNINFRDFEKKLFLNFVSEIQKQEQAIKKLDQIFSLCIKKTINEFEHKDSDDGI